MITFSSKLLVLDFCYLEGISLYMKYGIASLQRGTSPGKGLSIVVSDETHT
jgi:hypothetical protein